jgi:carbamoyltransferase
MHKRRNSFTYVSPSPGDGGSAIGAAYFGAKVLGWNMIPKTSAFVGPQLKPLSAYPHLFKPVTDESTTNEWVDQYLSQGEVLPFFQGIAEIGPRSLGVRSLICRIDHPAWIKNLNEAVKHRENFRPIAPIMLSSDPAIIHLELTPSEAIACRHMGTLVKTQVNFTRQLPQVEHVMHADRSMRLQLLSEQDIVDSRLHQCIPNLLKKYRVLANTSFNITGDPTVGTPLDCYINLRRMNLKYVAADNIVYQME